ncbi:radial spoke head protein 4 homolog A isoform X2 [Poecilia reticulata]|uniref:Radial spoke head component 4A n=1 Tax=Poecilia reticulata TaxID=8081 RepID=A0A3P9Q8U8_POERE|nr:PREDICTED: radial spoke head protein 4 homolog A isoform X2 [Poecilia reticulata]
MDNVLGRRDCRDAEVFKAFLMKDSTKSNRNLYEHLTQLLIKVIDEHTENAVDVVEEMSCDVKRALFSGIQGPLREVPQVSSAELLTEQQRILFSQPEEVVAQEDEMGETALPNVSEIAFYLEQAEVGLGREEMQRIFLALKHLVDSEGLPRCRLWGKILGIESNYIVAEAEYREGEEEQESIEDQPAEEEKEPENSENEQVEADPLPQSIYKPQLDAPKEAIGTGANKFAYYVCKEPGLPWIKLPSVSPAQINTARQIRKFFTGNLESPVGGEEEDDEEDEIPRDSFEVNPDFEEIPVSEMAESLSTWVHHVQHILQQGRCTWVNIAVKPDEESNEDEEGDENEEESEEVEPEVGPALLTPLSQDAEMFNTSPWSSKVSTILTFQHAIAVLRSNLWPGAFAYACGKKFENIYIGLGLKYVGEVYSPPIPPPPLMEYQNGPEITEGLDPTPEEEQALKEDLEEQQAALEEAEASEDDEDED